jgi:uncharacterized protein
MSESKYFLCKLLAPRPTFTLDMNDEERALMQVHAAYWRDHMRTGRVVIFGPVADPQGPWGLGIVRAASLPEVEAFSEQDPVIAAERGFRYEILPMLQAVLPADLERA